MSVPYQDKNNHGNVHGIIITTDNYYKDYKALITSIYIADDITVMTTEVNLKDQS